MTKMKVTNCHELSIRKDVTCPELEETVLTVVKKGTELLVDTSRVYWNWKDRQYYKVKTISGVEGYAPTDALTL